MIQRPSGVKVCGFRAVVFCSFGGGYGEVSEDCVTSSSRSEGVPPVLVTKAKNTPSRLTVLGAMCNL